MNPIYFYAYRNLDCQILSRSVMECIYGISTTNDRVNIQFLDQITRSCSDCRWLADHVDLADGFRYPAGALPVFGEKRGRIRHDLDDIAGFMSVSTAALEKMAKFIGGYVAIPVARSTDPDTGFRLAIGSLVQDNARSVRLTFDHGWNNAPVHHLGDGTGIL